MKARIAIVLVATSVLWAIAVIHSRRLPLESIASDNAQPRFEAPSAPEAKASSPGPIHPSSRKGSETTRAQASAQQALAPRMPARPQDAERLLELFQTESADAVSAARETEITELFESNDASEMLAAIECRQTLCLLKLHNMDRLDPELQFSMGGKLGRDFAPLTLNSQQVEALIPFDPDGSLPSI